MAKKGKVEEKGGKGKDAKKTKKEAVSDSEEITDAEVTNTEESEMGSEMVEEEEEEEESEDDPKKKKGRDKKAMAKGGKKGDKGKKGGKEEEGQEETSGKTKKKQMKGASKLVMGLATEDAKKKKGAKKDQGKSQLKGATKATATAKPEAEAEGAVLKKQRSLKSTSKLFMGFRGMVPKKNPKKGQFKNTSRFFWGLRKQSTKRKAKKKKNRGVLKSTSNLMMRFKELGKKKKKTREGPSGSTAKKPSYVLIRLGGGKVAEKKDKGGGFFGGLFRKKSRPNENFKPRAQVVSKVASATAWLTRRFLSKQRRSSSEPRVRDESWLSRIGAKKLPFPSGDEVMRHRANMRQTPERSALYQEPQEEFSYWDPVALTPLESHQGFREDDHYSPQPSGQYGYGDEGYAGNPLDEGYGPEEEQVDYYNQNQFDGRHYDDQGFEPVTGYLPYDPYGGFGNSYEEPPGVGGLGYKGAEEVAYPDDESYAQHEVSYSEHGWLPETQSYNPYAQPLADIAETDETEEEAEGPPSGSLGPFFLWAARWGRRLAAQGASEQDVPPVPQASSEAVWQRQT
ncbi:hypothetical protein JRQ81_010349 [Phrynocephalus forsythii]|uniref:Uncharacterized protein n=1 Tax=Phrynocephalus forsythii TaxID=171643 RepID=A0A9Q1ARG1_9SAUR|nr:hypothetical protein JRQ81_010349 [Phrynocephalus forsythii]